VRPVDLLELLDEGDHGDGLDGLAQAHVVGQDAADAALVETDHPVEAHQLVVLQLAALQQRGLLREAREDVILRLLLLDQLLDLLLLLVEVSAPLGLVLVLLPEDFVLGEEEVRVEFGLPYETLDGLLQGGVVGRLQRLQLLQYRLLYSALVLRERLSRLLLLPLL
jgi:hypothetical protein